MALIVFVFWRFVCNCSTYRCDTGLLFKISCVKDRTSFIYSELKCKQTTLISHNMSCLKWIWCYHIDQPHANFRFSRQLVLSVIWVLRYPGAPGPDTDVILSSCHPCPAILQSSVRQLCLPAYEQNSWYLTEEKEQRCCVPLCLHGSQSTDRLGRVIKIILIDNGRVRGEKYILNEKNINYITCSDPQAAEPICVSLH